MSKRSSAQFQDEDEVFFEEHPDRKIRIRLPRAGKNSQETESEREFRTLGPHARNRRRIIVARVPPMQAHMLGAPFMKIPFLAFADEEIADTDATLLPIFDEIMHDAAASYGMPARRK